MCGSSNNLSQLLMLLTGDSPAEDGIKPSIQLYFIRNAKGRLYYRQVLLNLSTVSQTQHN